MITWEWKSQTSADVHKIRKDLQVAPMIDKSGAAVYRQSGAHFVQACVSRNALRHFTQATLDGNLQEKRRGPKPRRRLCANLRGRNALQHFTKSTLHKKMQETCRVPHGAPRSSTGFYTYRTNPSVCTHTAWGMSPWALNHTDAKSLLALTENYVCCSLTPPISRTCLRIYTPTLSQRQWVSHTN